MPSIEIHAGHVSWRRLLAGGIILSALTGIAGGVVELSRFGASEEVAARKVARHIQDEFDRMVAAVSAVSARIATDPRSGAALTAGFDGSRVLFDVVAEARNESLPPGNIAVTIYDSGGARAWAGSPSDIPDDRIAGSITLFVVQTPLGLRLVHVQPITDAEGRRVGSVATEHELSPAPAGNPIAPTEFTIETPVAPATLLTRAYGAGQQTRPGAVPLRAPSGELLAEAWVEPSLLRQARTEWRRRVCAAMLAVIAATLALLAGPMLDRRASTARSADANRTRSYVTATIAASLLTAAGGLGLWAASAVYVGGWPAATLTLLLAGGTAAGIAAVLAGPIGRLRIARRASRRPREAAPVAFAVQQIVAGILVAAVIVAFARTLEAVVDPTSIDLRRFSLHPWRPQRLTLLAGVIAAHLAVLWGATMLLTAAASPWRFARRSVGARLPLLAAWIGPSIAAAAIATWKTWPVPGAGLALSSIACAVAAMAAPRLATWYRRTTVASRILALLLAFLMPALLLYPTVDYFAERATRELIEQRYAVQAQNHVQTLLRAMRQARDEVDRMPGLLDLLRAEAESTGAVSSKAAYAVWRQTVLARDRLTSGVELYNVEGKLASRFALNVPDVAPTMPQSSAGCSWDEFAEVAPVGAEERRMLHAERRICTRTEDGALVPHGAIVLHVVHDETLPFITSQNPYFELFRRTQSEAGEGTPGASVEVAIYGWGLQPLYTSGPSAWAITDALFARLYASRDPFWTDAEAGSRRHRVYFLNNRERIFAIGYPVLTLFEHFVHLAELTTFGGAAFALVLVGTALFTRLARERPRVGRALLREIRASFYRKLFLAFVLAAIVPVLILALLIRAYFANLLFTQIQAEAARTAAVAQRVVEEANALLRGTAEGFGTPSDDVMVWIEQVIDQDVNVFKGARLAATSERDLFESGVLPTRTPADVYRSIVLERLPSYVRQDSIGNLTYILAAAPVRAADDETLLTVPLAFRQREIEHERDELDRGVHLAALCFVFLGAGIGLLMAERIADPVRRLTRATGRIARGDFDARIAVKSADELRRLVDSFNSMAAELKAQRVQLERTHRLEAWAEMARQVAHEIKNPLTPIQLSAEHLRRVHADRGEPMGPLLESCVASILGQVRLLRQISSEFSNFASSPTARPAAVDPAELIAEVVDPYRTGLDQRIGVQVRVPGSLPTVFVDRTLIARSLVNIIENALYAMPGQGTLTIEADEEPDFVRIVFTDTGLGMDEEALARVFEPYFSTKSTGTGLGLPIARRNIELNGGAVTIASTRGVGTAVTVRLPRSQPPKASFRSSTSIPV